MLQPELAVYLNLLELCMAYKILCRTTVNYNGKLGTMLAPATTTNSVSRSMKATKHACTVGVKC